MLEALFARFERTLRDKGFTASGGQIIDASLISAPKQRNTVEEKDQIKQGLIPQSWKANPAKVRQKDRDARWKVKYGKAKAPAAGQTERRLVDLAIPAFGYQNHVAIDRDLV